MDILERLLLPFRGLFFASTGVMPDLGGGDGGGTGDSAGGDGGGVEETPADDGEQQEISEETPTDEGEGEEQPSEEEEIPEEEGEPGKDKGAKPTVESALNKLRKVDPKSAEVLRREHFQNVQYRSAGTPQEVQTMKDFMTLHGGEQGIENHVSKSEQFEEEVEMLARGDYQLVRNIASESPEGVMKLAPAVLAECQRIDPKRFGVMMAAPMARIFRETGVTPLMQQVSRFIKAGQQKEAFDAMAELMGWVGSVEQLAEQNQEQPISEREKQIQERDREVQNKETRIYQGEVGKASVTRTNSAIAKHLTPLINDAKKKGVALTLEQKQDLATGVYDEIAKSLKANTTYQRQMKAFYGRQASPEEIAEYVEGHVERLAHQATKAVWARKGWSRYGRLNPLNAGGSSRNGNQRPSAAMVSVQPSPENIDWSKDASRARFIGDGRVGEATLKNGKVVRWRWN